MDVTTFTITVFCLIDDWLASQSRPLRRRGPAPTLADSEVLTIECVGEFLGIATDSGLDQSSAATGRLVPGPAPHHLPPPGGHLWAVKHRLHQHLLAQVDFDPAVSLVDSVAVPICRFARAYRCRRLRELAAWATTRSPSNPTSGCGPIFGCAGPG